MDRTLIINKNLLIIEWIYSINKIIIKICKDSNTYKNKPHLLLLKHNVFFILIIIDKEL